MQAVKTAAFIGGPNVRKSTVIRILEAMGFPVIHEIATEVIKENKVLPWVDHLSFQHEVLRRQFEAEERLVYSGVPAFLDRGVYDAIAYRMVLGLKVQKSLLQLLPQRYDVAFLFPPMQEWDHNRVRYENPDFAEEITPYSRRVYEKQGIPVVDVPDGTSEDRARFVLRTLKIPFRTVPTRDSLADAHGSTGLTRTRKLLRARKMALCASVC